MDFSEEVLQMYAEIKEKSKYDYMICKFNNNRLVIEHIEKVENVKTDRNYSYEDFTRKLKGKQTFRYGFAIFKWIKKENISRKTVGVIWEPVLPTDLEERHYDTLKLVLQADLFIETSNGWRLGSSNVNLNFIFLERDRPMDIADEVLQMYNEIKGNERYDYMICKINDNRLVIEHIEQLSNENQDGSDSYEDFKQKITEKQSFRYGFTTFNMSVCGEVCKKTVGIAWEPTYGSHLGKQHLDTFKEALHADLFIKTSFEGKLDRNYIQRNLHR
ncbi:uncharacterized protein LOC133183655 [Saccostrea echinata]|uniref:uncharacterized protein LOC133183655 n=1 Tax=Saccostrea echinata TaxID=191078 RepID=UPI002A7F00CC|nr:uncharacterized protein LOC133183655 [Saccostrea echinata]